MPQRCCKQAACAVAHTVTGTTAGIDPCNDWLVRQQLMPRLEPLQTLSRLMGSASKGKYWPTNSETQPERRLEC
jgi:hypothetical protein